MSRRSVSRFGGSKEKPEHGQRRVGRYGDSFNLYTGTGLYSACTVGLSGVMAD